ncbi:LYS9, Saccharopine dehydrogenase, lysine biosynthesis pathway [Polychaeton citri CBS 116435]|uniref:Saccharopine dehydrogenase [NADP(+), L-glutamate-forming] n=1 Tax=Polychaeton citri CBS 116435 TaxID=1314669 RepID=A0A9P4Q1T5_9PEZI|nr:LYS9, Saccharopine dehydrogenase, lysine biosynthesis pathway [Polychaeton citri CBS 116435]
MDALTSAAQSILPGLTGSKSVLLLGSGFVTKPCAVELDKSGIIVTVACRTLESAKSLSAGLKHAKSISLDVSDAASLEAEIAKNDLVISLIPYTFHAQVIKAAINVKKHVVTTSYVSDAMMALDKEAKEAGITVMNEIGVDPGVDHLWAVKTIDEVHKAGGKIKSFLSYCGGLPAPESSDNPLGYKFSWSPRGVLLAARNTATFYKDGKKDTIVGSELMRSARPYYVYPGFAFEAYPNRDSTPFRERYDIPEAETLIRGTMRYQGNPAFVQTLNDLGFLSDEEDAFLKASGKPAPTWAEATAKVVGTASASEKDLLWAISSKTNFKDTEEKERIVAGLRWVGLFSNEKIEPRGNPLDCLCAALEKKMQYEEGERDMVMLQHKFGIEWADGKTETRTSTMCEYGAPEGSGGYSAMAKLVGVPCAVAVKMVLNGEISDRGILAPVTPRYSEPLRIKLQQEYGIECKEKTLA